MKKYSHQIAAAVAIALLAIITLPENWPTFAKVVSAWLAIHAVHVIITRLANWHKNKLFAKIEENERRRRRENQQASILNVKPEQMQTVIDGLKPEVRNYWRTAMKQGRGNN